MRIEIITGQARFGRELNALLTKTNSVLDSFTAVKNGVYQMNGGVGILQNALDSVENRIHAEEQRLENMKNTQTQYEQFLENVATTDRDVAELVTKNKEEFYKVNPWAKPSIATLIRELMNKILRIIKEAQEKKERSRWKGVIHTIEDKFIDPVGKNKGPIPIGGGLAAGAAAGILAEASSGTDDRSFFQRLGEDGKVEGSVWSKKGSVSANIEGLEVSGSAYGNVLHGSVSTVGEANFSWKEGKDSGTFGAKIGIKADGHVLDGGASGQVGALKGSISGGLLNASGNASAGITLFDDGELRPQVYAEVKGNANVAEGKIGCTFGSDDLSGGLNANGSVLGVDGKAGVRAGKIVNDDGTEKWGVDASAKAEAYIAKGRVGTEFNVLGIKFKVGATGMIGLSAGAGGEVSTDGVGGNIEIGPVGLDVGIDWSGFNPGHAVEKAKEFVGNVAEVAQTVGNYVGESLSNVADTVKGWFSWG